MTMNAIEATKISIERKPLFEAEMKIKYEQEELVKLERILTAINDCANRGEQSLKWRYGYEGHEYGFLNQDNKSKLEAMGFFIDDWYSYSYSTYFTIAWGDEIEKVKQHKKQRDDEMAESLKPKKKWYQIF